MREELKECPFCACEVEMDTDSEYSMVQGDHSATCPFLDDAPIASAEEWNTRAQLPNQGGDAVAWRVTGAGGLTVAAEYPRWAEDDSRLLIESLYTHADPLPGLRLALDLLTEDGQGFMQKRVIVDKLIELGVTLPPDQLM